MCDCDKYKKMQMCNNCGATGKIEITSPLINTGTNGTIYQTKEEACPECKGSGWVEIPKNRPEIQLGDIINVNGTTMQVKHIKLKDDKFEAIHLHKYHDKRTHWKISKK